MSMTQPLARIKYAAKEVGRFSEDIEDWKQEHEKLTDCWFWEDMIAKANFLFGRIIDLDLDIQEAIFGEKSRIRFSVGPEDSGNPEGMV